MRGVFNYFLSKRKFYIFYNKLIIMNCVDIQDEHAEFFESYSSPAEVLERFYRSQNIKSDDLDGKLRAMSGMITVPNFDYSRGKQPSLSELELAYLREKGIEL